MIAIPLLLSLVIATNPVPNLRVPAGFVVTEFADSTLANDILSMTVDSRGRIVVAGHGYIRILIDDDSDGRADRAVQFANSPRDGAQGMLWEGDSLYVSGDGGLRRFRATKDGLHAAWGSALIRAAGTGGEHVAHSIKRGPDGRLYWLLGNSAGVRSNFVQLQNSPIRDPLAGCLVRFSPNLQKTEVVADGLRNAYDFDFNLQGEPFTFDSDNERCVSLPWYEGTRFYRLQPGGHYGWLNPQRAETWRTPPYVFDVVVPLLDLGRGSPTAVVCYRAQQFPRRYQGSFFLFDWTFGRVYSVSLEPTGAGYRATKEIFLESTGDDGFAPTSALVHPTTGDLFIAIGGRGTRGSVYRVRYQRPADLPAALPASTRASSTESAPSSSSLRQSIQSLSKSGPSDQLSTLQRLLSVRNELTPGEIRSAVLATWNGPERSIRQAAASLLSLQSANELHSMAEQVQTDAHRATLVMASIEPARKLAEAEATRLLQSGQTAEMRLVGVRAIQLLLGGQGSRSLEGTTWEGYSARLPWWLDPATIPAWRRRLPRMIQSLMTAPSRSVEGNLSWEAFATRLAGQLEPATLTIIRTAFPSGEAILDRELSRTLAMIGDEDPGLLERVSQRWSSTSDPIDDVHYLLVFARLQGPRTPALTRTTAHTLLLLDDKLTNRKGNRERNWYLRISELYTELARRDPGLHQALLADPVFGKPDHALFAHAAGFSKAAAVRRFLTRAATDSSFEWNADLVSLLGELPQEEALPVARTLWQRGGLQEPLLRILAQHPAEEDRSRFWEGLGSPQLVTVQLCLDALGKLKVQKTAANLLPIVQAFGRLPDEKATQAIRRQFARDLAQWTGQTSFGLNKELWRTWFMAEFPAEASKLLQSDGIDRTAWDRRLAKVDWSEGTAERGRAVFQQVNCASCHSGARALGPDLKGVTNRFSRDDLFTAILQPSRDISARYRTTQIITSDDKIYQGLIVYEAVDSLLLQTGPATTARITNQQITSKRTTDISLMPAGLLDKATDRDIADLYAYLKSLR
jgi:putative heme-binding domain-containing protein